MSMSSEEEAEMRFSDEEGEEGKAGNETPAEEEAPTEYDQTTGLDRDINFGIMHLMFDRFSKKKGFFPKLSFDEVENAIKRPGASGILSKLATILLKGVGVSFKGGSWDPALSQFVAKRVDDFDDCFIADDKRMLHDQQLLQHDPPSPMRGRPGVSILADVGSPSPGSGVGEKRPFSSDDDPVSQKRVRIERAKAKIKRFVREWGRPEEDIREMEVSSDEDDDDDDDDEEEGEEGKHQSDGSTRGDLRDGEGTGNAERNDDVATPARRKRSSKEGGTTIVLDEFGDLTLEERLSVFCRLAELQLRESSVVGLPTQIPRKPKAAKGKEKQKEEKKADKDSKMGGSKGKESGSVPDAETLFADWRSSSLGMDRHGFMYYWYHDSEYNFRVVRWKPQSPGAQFRRFLQEQGILVGRAGRRPGPSGEAKAANPHTVTEPRSSSAEPISPPPHVAPDASKQWEVVCSTLQGLKEFREKFTISELGQADEANLRDTLSTLEVEIQSNRESIERNKKRQERLLQQLGGFSYSGPSRRSSRLATRKHYDEDEEEEEFQDSDSDDGFIGGGRMLRRRRKRINYNVDNALESMLESKDESEFEADDDVDDDEDDEDVYEEDSDDDVSTQRRSRLRKVQQPINTALSRAERAKRRELGLPADWDQ